MDNKDRFFALICLCLTGLIICTTFLSLTKITHLEGRISELERKLEKCSSLQCPPQEEVAVVKEQQNENMNSQPDILINKDLENRIKRDIKDQPLQREKRQFNFDQLINETVQVLLKTALSCQVNTTLGTECTLKPGPKGDQGEKGETGMKGLKGDTGSTGLQGQQGVRGYNGLTGSKGQKGVRGYNGLTGSKGQKGVPGYTGLTGSKGQKGDTNSGTTYIRWGRTTCPSGAVMLYNGRAAGSPNHNSGGTSDYLCLPSRPRYQTTYKDIIARLDGVEYEGWPSSYPRAGHDNMPCVVCHVPTRSAMFVQQASYLCPSGWNREYYGYMMSNKWDHRRTSTICVDASSQAVPGTGTSTNRLGLYLLSVLCPHSYSELACGPYVDGRILSCAVCTK